jgi:hypothetical protein
LTGGSGPFLYDATIAFAGLTNDGRIAPDSAEADDAGAETAEVSEIEPPARPVVAKPLPQARGIAVMENERELTTGLLSKDANFRLIVSGPVGVREIERLIRKLELDKEILADESEDTQAE